MNQLSHVQENGKAQMVDVTDKAATFRIAKAECCVLLPQTILDLFQDGEWNSPKGAVIQTARLAGIQAVKQTSQLIPLCHPLLISFIDVHMKLTPEGIQIQSEVKCAGKTGVEMEALTGVTVAALTIYDMVKALSFEIEITNVKLVEKKGGKSDFSRT
jgi:cyclic pyranopterin phosphate synthase